MLDDILFHHYSKEDIIIDLSKRRKLLQKELNKLEKQITKLPPGSLICSKNGKYYKWYQNIDDHYHYINKAKIKLAKDLANKKLISAQIQDITAEIKAIDSYTKKYNPTKLKANNILNQPCYQELLKDRTCILSDKLKAWQSETYEKSTYMPEHLRIEAKNGLMVRSKSEQLIDSILWEYGIPHRYECLLDLNGQIIYPDFTLLHPETEEILYWEHFGMMDSINYYQRNFISKIQTYINNGIIPDINLICTFETSQEPLSYKYLKKKIEQFFS